MSHQIIIPYPPGSGNLVAQEGSVVARVEWTPSHGLTAQQERRRIERAEVKLAELAAALSAPVEDHIE
jgi:hypothetical protein